MNTFQNIFRRTGWWGIVVLFIAVSACNGPMPKIVLYPAPQGLEEVEGLSKSPYYDVTVEGEKAFVYYGKDNAPNRSYEDKGLSFLSFEMSSGPVEMLIKTNLPVDSFRILPTYVQGEKISENTLRITVDEPHKFLLTTFTPDKTKEDFVISAEMPDWEKPKSDAKGVLYLAPGVHQFGMKWNPFKDGIHTLYLEGGAVVEATLDITDAKNVNILGRGIFAQAFADRKNLARGEDEGINFYKVPKVQIEGISVINSPGCQLAITDANEVIIDNIKLLGFGELNNDGLHAYSRNFQMRNSFICSGDHRIRMNGLYHTRQANGDKLASSVVENVVLSDLVLWGVNSGSDLMLSHNAISDTRTVFAENLYSLTATSGAFLAAEHSGSGNIFDVVVTNSHLYHGNLIDLCLIKPEVGLKESNIIRDVVLDNITLDVNPNEVERQIMGYADDRYIQGVIFSNIQANGKIINQIGESSIIKNKFVKDVTFQQKMP